MPRVCIEPHPGMSQAVRKGRQLVLSGQVALDESGEVVGEGDAAAQCQQIFRNIERLDFKDARIYLDGRNNAPRARADRGFSTRDGVPVSIPFAALLANDRDFDEDPLTVAIPARHDAGGSVRVENGAVVYTPARGVQWALADFDSYTDTFFYAATDGRGGQSLASAGQIWTQ